MVAASGIEPELCAYETQIAPCYTAERSRFRRREARKEKLAVPLSQTLALNPFNGSLPVTLCNDREPTKFCVMLPHLDLRPAKVVPLEDAFDSLERDMMQLMVEECALLHVRESIPVIAVQQNLGVTHALRPILEIDDARLSKDAPAAFLDGIVNPCPGFFIYIAEGHDVIDLHLGIAQGLVRIVGSENVRRQIEDGLWGFLEKGHSDVLVDCRARKESRPHISCQEAFCKWVEHPIACLRSFRDAANLKAGRQNETIMFKNIAEALCELTCELGKWREQREREIKCHAGLATLADLHATERRLRKAIGGGDTTAIAGLTQDLNQSTEKLKQAVDNNDK